ncbi:MAG: hypothetical protein M3342_16575 [Bacteroidota bacterium]|nr:hypothetical protein [Bacteroidota bacterium]
MRTLFPIEPVLPEGFIYLPDFITVAEERELCEQISNIALHTFRFQGYEAKRRGGQFWL